MRRIDDSGVSPPSSGYPWSPRSAIAVLKRFIERRFPDNQRLARGVVWLFAGAVVARSLGLLASIVVARELGLDAYGKFGILQSTLAMFQTFAGFGLGETATKFVAELRTKDPHRAGKIAGLSSATALGAGVLFCLLLFCCAPLVARRALAAPELATALRAGAPVLLFGAMVGAQTGALSGLEAFRTVARIAFISGLLSLPLLVGGVYFGGIAGGMGGLALTSAATWGLNQRALNKEFKRAQILARWRGCWDERRVLVDFSLPAVLAGALVVPVYWFCATLLVKTPDGYAEMGVFNAANQWYQALLFIPILVSQAALPILAHRLGNGAGRQAVKTLWLSIKTNAAFAASVAIVLMLCSPMIMSSYGPAFRSGWPTLVIILVTSAIFATITPVGQLIAASGAMWVGFAMNAGWAISFIALSFALVRFGAEGFAGARLIAYSLHGIWTFAYGLHLQRKLATNSATMGMDEPPILERGSVQIS